MSHTPGPWKISGYAGQHEEAGAHIKSEDGRTICSTWGGLQEISPLSEWQRYHADAKLIAAAPDLLAALQAYVANDADQFLEEDDPLSPPAIRAIEKATGNKVAQA